MEPTNEKQDAYEKITNRIVESLEKGTAPWVRPWNCVGKGQPHNGHSGYEYRGINVVLCWSSGFSDSRWYTFLQVKGYGTSHVRKGSHGTPIVKWTILERENATTGKVEKIPMLRTYTVFNHEQIEWDPAFMPATPAPVAIEPGASHEAAAELLARSGAKVSHGGNQAFYSRATDAITLPPVAAFTDLPSYWATALHELTHWTGHESRNNRTFGKRFGDQAYAFEELVAEMGAAFLCDAVGIAGKLQHTEYIANWIRVLKGDKRAIFTAASQARKACEFLGPADTGANDDSEPAAIAIAEVA